MKKLYLGLLFAVSFTFSAFSAEIKPALVYDLGGKDDKSFNEAAYTGAERFLAETGIPYRDFEIQNDAQREQALRRFAKDGYTPIVAIGFSHASALEKVSKEFPKTQFAIVDMVVDAPNVRSVVFSEHEGSFLVGIMAAKASKTGKVGFVGGMDNPLNPQIRLWLCTRCQVHQPECRNIPKHDRHNRCRMERPRQRWRASPFSI